MPGMRRRSLLRAALAAPFVHTAARSAPKRPNVVMFMTDDHGAWALGAYGCREMHTPHIDRLAAGGARFDRAFACTPVCSPSRMTYMTGRLPSTHSVQDWLQPVDSFGENSRLWLQGHPTWSEALAKGGYTLGMSGKWHMGRDEQAQAGFSYWATAPGGGGRYRDAEFVVNGKRVAETGYKTDFVGDCALEFLEQRRGKDQPFYLYVPFYAPHTPYDYQPEKYREPYRNSPFSCYPREDLNPLQNSNLGRNHLNTESMHAYSALVTGVDANVGRVVEQLEKIGVRDNTLIVFTADQGWNAGHHGFWGKGNGTVPFNMFEESIRVPMIWNHPGRIRESQVLRPMISSYDYLPSILDYLDLPAPPDPLRAGRSYAGFLAGRAPRWRNRLYFEYAYVRGIRTENLKLVQRTREWPSEFYDLEADPGEKRNVIDDPAHRRQLASLRQDMDGFFGRFKAPPMEDWRSTTTQNLATYRLWSEIRDVKR